MSHPFRLLGTFACSVLVMAILMTCSDDTSTGPDNGGPGGGTITLADSTAPSGSWVPLTGLPSDSGYYGVVTSTTKAGDTGYAAVARTDSGDFLLMPLNPADPIGGGEVQVVITNGAKTTTEPIALTLDSLPPAPGEFEAVVSLMQDILTEQLRISGLTRDSLTHASVQDIPLSQVPYVLLYSAIDSPDNPNNLRALADGPVPYLNNTEIDTDLMDRLVGMMDIREYFADKLASLDTVTVSFVPDYTIDSRVGQVSAAADCIPPPDYGISTCGALSNAMTQQFSLELAATSVEGKLDNAVISGVLIGVSLIPGGAPVSAGIGAVLWTDGVINEGFQNMLPSEFVDAPTLFDPSEQEFPEDFTQPGEWTKFEVSATSKGWTLDKVALESVMQVLGASAAGDAIGATPGSFADEVEGAMKGYVEGNVSGQVINELTDESGLIQVCANTWTGIDCVGEDFTTVTSLNGILDVDETNQQYEPTQTGEDFLKIETKNVFGGGNMVGTTIPVNANQIELFIDPFQAEADTSEQIGFTIRVEHAEDPAVEFNLANGGFFSSDQASAQVFTPDAPWDPPLILSAKSTANTGLREGKVDSDPRVDSVEITYRGEGVAVVTPGNYCVKPGQSQEFTVTYTGSQIESVEWEIDPPGVGSIVGSGETITYNAPGQPAGNVTLSATVNDTSTGYAYVDVSSCRCNWYFSSVGAGSLSGEFGFGQTLGALWITLQTDTAQGFDPFVSLISYGFNGDTGTFAIDGMGYYISAEEDWEITDPDQLLPTLVVDAYVQGDYIEGRATGQLSNQTNFNPPEYEYITFDLTFRAEFFNLERPQCVEDTSGTKY